VMEVMHERISPDLLLDEVEVQVQLETRGPEHSATLVTRLRERGYRVIE
jgi:threonine dehydratase